MKKVLFFVFFSLLSFSTFAQLQLVSSSPANGDFAVNQDSIVLEFNLPIYFDTEYPENSGFQFIIEPEDSVYYDSVKVSEDNLKVTFYAQFASETDYMAILAGAEGLSGEKLNSPHIIQFTTATTPGAYTVHGKVSKAELEFLKASSENYNGVAVFLSHSPLDFELGFEETMEEDTTYEEDDFFPLYGATVDTTTGEYVITGVREDFYFPVGLNLHQIFSEQEFSEFFFPDLYIYDPDEDYMPNEIEVSASSTTADTLFDVDLIQLDFSAFSFSEAISRADHIISDLDNSPVLVGGTTFYFYAEEYEEEFLKRTKTSFSTRKLELPKFKITNPGNFKPFEESALKAKSSLQNEEDPFGTPNGYNMLWEVYIYDSIKDSAAGIFVTPFGSFFTGYFGANDVELPEGFDFSDLKPLPETFIDSDTAVDIMEAEGGAAFRDEYGVSSQTESGSWYMDLTALHSFWEYYPNPTPSAPVMWVGYYDGYKYNYETEEYTDDFLMFFLDIETGEVLLTLSGSDSSSTNPISFSEAVGLAQQSLSDLENDPVIVGGGTYYYYYLEPFKRTNKPEIEHFPSILNQKMSKTALVQNDPSAPNGYQSEWEIYAYDAVKDSALGLYVTSEGAEFMGYIGPEDAELPDGVTFDSIKLLPENYIDSDSAAVIIEAEGGAAFREMFSGNTQSESGWWSMDLQALHEYWKYTPDPTSSAPVMWKAAYYGEIYNSETENYTQDSLLIFLDIESGAVLYTAPVSAEVGEDLPFTIRLHQNYPNPFNPATNITFDLNSPTKVDLSIYNLIGQKVATLANDRYPAGSHIIKWNASDLASGMYFYRLEAGGTTHTKKMMLLK